MGFLKRIWAAAPVAVVILALALAATLFFTVRTVAFWIYWSDPNHRDQTIQPWMTPQYVAHSWHVPRPVMLNALGLPDGPQGRPLNLRDIAALNGITVEELIASVEAAIDAHRLAHPEGPRP